MRINTSPVQRLARNYVIINGRNSQSVRGLIIQELPTIRTAKMRTQSTTVDGRDGEIITKLGYEAYDKTIKIGLYGDYDVDQVISFFATSGEIIFSNEADKKYRFSLYDEINMERLGRFRTANVTIRVEPYKYSAIDESVRAIQQRRVTYKPCTQARNGVTVTATDDSITVTGTTSGGAWFFVPANPEWFSVGTRSIDITATDASGVIKVQLVRGQNVDSEHTFGDPVAITTAGTQAITGTGGNTYDTIYIYVAPGSVNTSFIIERDELFSDVFVVNRGNTEAKPKITITGAGVLQLSVNRAYICDIEIPAAQDGIVIDVETMDAHWINEYGQKTGDAYRGITGDFTQAVFSPGQNVVDIEQIDEGSVTGVLIENISRWL